MDESLEQSVQNGNSSSIIQDRLQDLEEVDAYSSVSSSAGSAAEPVDSLPTMENILNEDVSSHDESLVGGTFADADIRDRYTLDISELEQSFTSSAESVNSFTHDSAQELNHDSLVKLVKLRDVSSGLGKTESGNPTVIHCGTNIAVGTSTGFVHVFDLGQKLVCKCVPASKNVGPVSALDINRDEKALLVGFASGSLVLYELPSGKLSKIMEDLHLFESSVLNIRFTDDPAMAVFTDNGGSVYALEVRSTLGRKNVSSTCIFSGSKGEAFVAEPLRVVSKMASHRLAETIIVAVASLNKVIIAELKPVLRSVFSFPYNASPSKPPVLEWHIVTMHSEQRGKSVEPVLAVATGNTIVFLQVSSAPDDVMPKCSFIQRTNLNFTIINLKWINNYMVAVLDTSECMHVVDIRSQTVLDTIDLSIVGIVYQSSFYKGLTTSRTTSQAMASVGNIACLQSVGSFHGQVILLGTGGVFVASLRLWFERVDRLVKEGHFLEALRMLLDMSSGQAKGVLGLTKDPKERKAILRRQIRHLVEVVLDDCVERAPQSGIVEILRDHFVCVVPICIEACCSSGNTEFLFGELYDRFASNTEGQIIFLESIEPLILNDQLREITPGVMQDLIELHKDREQFTVLESLIVKLDVQSFDLHNVISLCRQYNLFDGFAYIYTLAFQDARTPLEEYLMMLRKAMLTSKVLSAEMVALGNKLIVFVSCCLNGLQYPAGSTRASSHLTSDVFQTLFARHSRNPEKSEPAFVHLRTFLDFDATEILNVFAMAFAQPYFKDSEGDEVQQQLVDRLQQILAQGDQFEPGQISAVSTFIARMMTRPESKIVINRMLIEQTLEVLCASNLRSRHDERESAVLEMYHSGVLNHIDDNMVIRLAETAQFWRVCEILYEKHGMYGKLLFCYLDDTTRNNQSFAFLQRLLISPLYERHEKDLVREAFVARFPQLLALDFQKAVVLTYSCMFSEVLRLCKRLEPDVWQQYLFMREVFNFVSKSAVASQSDSTLFPVHYHNVLVDLMCEVQPSTVYDHLRSNDMYDVDQALNACRTFGIVRGAAYLLEKKGSVDDAFEVLLNELRRVMDAYLVSQQYEVSQEVYGKTYQRLKDTLEIVVDFCQRSSARTDQALKENMYQQVLKFMLDAINTSADVMHDNRRSDLRRLSADLLKSMTGQVDVLVFLKRVLDDSAYIHGKFGELRELLLGILDTYLYEQVLLSSTRNLLRKDIHDQVSLMKRTAARAVRIKSSTCGLCRSLLRCFPSSDETQAKLIVFRCGHAFHAGCVSDLAQASSSSPREQGNKCVLCDK